MISGKMSANTNRREVRCGTHMLSLGQVRDPPFGYPEHSNW
jgi:hypothetical protein